MSEKTIVTEDPYADIAEETSLSTMGSVCIHNDVIAVIAFEAASKVNGVAELSGSVADGIAGMIGKRSSEKGIRVEVEGDSVKIELSVVLAHGVKIPRVAWDLQQSVKSAVEEMTGKTVAAVNVIVQSIKIPSHEA